MRCRRTTHLQEIEKGLVFLLKSYSIYLEGGREPPRDPSGRPRQRQIWMDSLVPDFLPLHCKKSRGGRRPGSCQQEECQGRERDGRGRLERTMCAYNGRSMAVD
jgi:hypothetical protein